MGSIKNTKPIKLVIATLLLLGAGFFGYVILPGITYFALRRPRKVTKILLSQANIGDTVEVNLQPLFRTKIDSIVVMPEYFTFERTLEGKYRDIDIIYRYKGDCPQSEEVMLFVFFGRKRYYREVFSWDIEILNPIAIVSHEPRLTCVVKKK